PGPGLPPGPGRPILVGEGWMRIPYPTIVCLEQAIDVAAEMGEGARLDRIDLIERGFAPNAVGPALDALVFAGVLDETQLVTRAGASFRQAPQEPARAALASVLARLRPPYPDRGALAAALGPVTGMTLTTLPLVATFLVWLSEQAGVDLV